MEEYGLKSFEDPSEIIEDVVEISVENSVEVNLLPVNNKLRTVLRKTSLSWEK